MDSEVRLLEPADRPALERFLGLDLDRTMFLRSNLAAAGIDYDGSQCSAQYVGAWRGDDLVAVVAHCWNDHLLVHAPRHLSELVRAAVQISRRRVAGILGPREQVTRARAVLELDDAPVGMDSRDILFALDLERLRTPALLFQPDSLFTCRPATDDDLDLLTEYRVAYSKETLGARDSAELAQRCRDQVAAQVSGGDAWLLCERSRPVACSFFNARVPDCVQIGGVYTPPELRRRGFGRAVVAGSLAAVRSQGVRRSILFTGESNHPAQAAYRAIGYQPVSEYGLILFAD